MIPQRLKSPGRIRSAMKTIQRAAAKTPSLVPESLILSRLEVSTSSVPYGSVRGFEVAPIACFGVSIDILPGFSYSYSALAVLVLVLEDTASSTSTISLSTITIKVKTSQLQKSQAGLVVGLSITIP